METVDVVKRWFPKLYPDEVFQPLRKLSKLPTAHFRQDLQLAQSWQKEFSALQSEHHYKVAQQRSPN